VKDQVGDTIVPGEVGKAVNNTMIEELLNEIAEYRGKVSALLNESDRLENLSQNMNKTYLLTLIDEARTVLSNASDYLNRSEAAALAGNLTEAFDYLNRAKVNVEYAEDILEDVAKLLGTELMYEEDMEAKESKLPKLAEKLNDLADDIMELRMEVEKLLNNSEVQNNNVSLTMVQQALDYLNNASSLIDAAWTQLDAGNYSEALKLYNEAYRLYEAAELNIDLVEEWIEESDDREIMDSMLDKMYDYREEIEELSSKALYLYNIAVEENDSEAAQLILNAQEKLKNASDILYQVSDLLAIGAYNDASELLSQVAMLIADAKKDLNQAAVKLNVMGMDDDHDGEDSDDESGDSDSDDHDDSSGNGDDSSGDDMGGGHDNRRNGGEDEEDEEDDEDEE